MRALPTLAQNLWVHSTRGVGVESLKTPLSILVSKIAVGFNYINIITRDLLPRLAHTVQAPFWYCGCCTEFMGREK